MLHIKKVGAFPMSTAVLKEAGTKGTVSQVKDDVITYINHKPAGGEIRFLGNMRYYLMGQSVVSFKAKGYSFHFTEEDVELITTPILSDAEINYVSALNRLMDMSGYKLAEDGILESPQQLHKLLGDNELLRPGFSWRNLYRLEDSLESKGILSRSEGMRFIDMDLYDKSCWYSHRVAPFLRYSDRHRRDAEAMISACFALNLYRSHLEQLKRQ